MHERTVMLAVIAALACERPAVAPPKDIRIARYDHTTISGASIAYTFAKYAPILRDDGVITWGTVATIEFWTTTRPFTFMREELVHENGRITIGLDVYRCIELNDDTDGGHMILSRIGPSQP